MKAFTIIGLILFLIMVQSPVSSSQNFQCISESQSIAIWRNDPYKFNITDVSVHPLYTESGLPIFGEVYITWILRNEKNESLPIFAYYKQNKLFDFQVFDYSLGAEWFVSATEVLLVQTFSDSTKFIWISSIHKENTLDLPYTIQDFNARLIIDRADILQTSWEIQYRLNATSSLYSGEWGLFTSPDFIETSSQLLSSWVFSGLYLNLSSQIYFVQSFDDIITLDLRISNPELFLLGYNTFDLFAPNLMVIGEGQIYSLKDSSFIRPPGLIHQIFRYGISSSIIQSVDGYFEYVNNEWQAISTIPSDSNVDDLLAFDLGLYLGVKVETGVSIQYFGDDDDDDGLPSVAEFYYASDPLNPDSDGDGFNDLLEAVFGTSPSIADGDFDYDGDGLTNSYEYDVGLDPLNKDTDFGGATDGFEIKYGFNPCDRADDNLDPDNDGLDNGVESNIGTSPLKYDSDSDGINDRDEYLNNLDPLNPSDAFLDYDGDGRSNLNEFKYGTDPFSKDSPPPLVGLEVWFLVLGSPLVAVFLMVYKKYLQGFLKTP